MQDINITDDSHDTTTTSRSQQQPSHHNRSLLSIPTPTSIAPHQPILTRASPYYVNVGWLECDNRYVQVAPALSQPPAMAFRAPKLSDAPFCYNCIYNNQMTSHACAVHRYDVLCPSCVTAATLRHACSSEVDALNSSGKLNFNQHLHCDQQHQQNFDFPRHVPDPHSTGAPMRCHNSGNVASKQQITSHAQQFAGNCYACHDDVTTSLLTSTPARKNTRVDRVTRTKRHYRRAAMTSTRDIYRVSISSESDVEFARSLRNSIARSLRSSARAKERARTSAMLTPHTQTQNDADVSETGTSTADVDSDVTATIVDPQTTPPTLTTSIQMHSSHLKQMAQSTDHATITLANAFIPIDRPSAMKCTSDVTNAQSDVASDDSVRSQFGSTDQSDSSSSEAPVVAPDANPLSNQLFEAPRFFEPLHVSTWPPDDVSLLSSQPLICDNYSSSHGASDVTPTTEGPFNCAGKGILTYCDSFTSTPSELLVTSAAPPLSAPSLKDMKQSERLLKPLPLKHPATATHMSCFPLHADALAPNICQNNIRPSSLLLAHDNHAPSWSDVIKPIPRTQSWVAPSSDPTSEECMDRLERSLPEYVTESELKSMRGDSRHKSKHTQRQFNCSDISNKINNLAELSEAKTSASRVESVADACSSMVIFSERT